jgi:hypothetical protein
MNTNTNTLLCDSIIPKEGKNFQVSLDEHFYFKPKIGESMETPSPLVSAAPMPNENMRIYQPEDEFIVNVLVTLSRERPPRNIAVVAEKDSQQRMSEKPKPMEIIQVYPRNARRINAIDQSFLPNGDLNSSSTDEENGMMESGASSSEEFLENSEMRTATVRKSSSMSPQSFVHQTLKRRNGRRSDSDGYSSGPGVAKRALDDYASTKEIQPRRRYIKQRKIINDMGDHISIEAGGVTENITRFTTQELSLEEVISFEEKYDIPKPGRKKLLNVKRGSETTSTLETKAKRARWPRFACDKHRREHAKCPDNCPLRPKKINDSL